MYVGLSSLGLNTAPFAVSPITSLFRSGEPGAVFIAQKPSDLYARRNLFTETEFRNGTSDAPTKGPNVTATTLSGYAGALAFPVDAVNGSYAYKGNYMTIPGLMYTVSAVIAMDDGLVPVFSGAETNPATDFALVIGNAAVSPSKYVIESLGNGRYRVSGSAFATQASLNNGISKYPTNSARTFKATAYQLERTSSVTAYQPVTDWTTEYLAQAGNLITQYTLADGSVPVMNLEDPVGLHLDTRPYFGSNTELASANYTPLAGGDNTVSGVTASGFTSTFVSITPQVYGNITTVIGRTYKFTFTVASSAVNVSAVVRSAANGGGGNISTIPSTASGGTTSIVFTATTTASSLVWAATTGNFTISGITCKEYVAAPNTLGQPLRGANVSASTGTTVGWNTAGGATLSSDGTSLTVTNGAATEGLASSVTSTAGVWYEITFDVVSASNFGALAFAGSRYQLSVGTGKRYLLRGDGSTIQFGVNAGALGFTLVIKNVSIKAVYGNHRSQAAVGARGTLSARYNKVTARNANPVDLTGITFTNATNTLGTFTLVSDPAALAAAGLSGICTLGNVFKLDNSAGNSNAFVDFPGQVGNTNNHQFSVWMRGSGSAYFATGGSPGTPLALSANYVKKTETTAVDLTTRQGRVIATTGAVVYFILFDMREACYSYLPTPQVVWDATTGYDDSGFPARIKYSGAQGYATAAVDLSGSDKAQMIFGVTKLSDAAQATLFESTNTIATAGSIAIFGPQSAAGNSFNANVNGGTTFVGAFSAATSPTTNVVTGVVDCASATQAQIRLNGGAFANSSSGAGAGPLANGTFNYGARANGTSIYYIGDEFISIVRGGPAPATGTIYSVEQAVGRYMGLNI